jgi:hypothetical protein
VHVGCVRHQAAETMLLCWISSGASPAFLWGHSAEQSSAGSLTITSLVRSATTGVLLSCTVRGWCQSRVTTTTLLGGSGTRRWVASPLAHTDPRCLERLMGLPLRDSSTTTPAPTASPARKAATAPRDLYQTQRARLIVGSSIPDVFQIDTGRYPKRQEH